MKVGHSHAVTIPANFCQQQGIKSGDDVKVEVYPETGRIIYQFSTSYQMILSEDLFRKKSK